MHPSDSSPQRWAEEYIRKRLGALHGGEFRKERFPMGTSYMEIDAVCIRPKVVCEISARLTQPKPGQKSKVIKDALKLHLARQRKGWKHAEAYLVFASKDAANYWQNDSWMAAALRELSIEVKVVQLPRNLGVEVSAAQRRQSLASH